MFRRPPRSALFPSTPLFRSRGLLHRGDGAGGRLVARDPAALDPHLARSEEHTSELQSQSNLTLHSLFFKCSGAHRDLPSFPPRRSSVLVAFFTAAMVQAVDL